MAWGEGWPRLWMQNLYSLSKNPQTNSEVTLHCQHPHKTEILLLRRVTRGQQAWVTAQEVKHCLKHRPEAWVQTHVRKLSMVAQAYKINLVLRVTNG